jgi:hypothetical protein
MAANRQDYFDAGTIAADRVDATTQPSLFAKGQVAEAEPALPGWRVPLDEFFPLI